MDKTKRKYKLAILTSTSIVPYRAALFKKINEVKEIELLTYFCTDYGAKKEVDLGFGNTGKWDVPLLEGFNYKFLFNLTSFLPPFSFFGQINPGIIKELIKNKYDGVIIFGWTLFTNWLVIFSAFLHKTPILCVGENPLNQELLKSKWKRTIKKIVLGWLFKRISAFLYIGEENKKFYQYYGVPEKKLFFAPYAVDNEHFIEAGKSLSENRKSSRKELGIREGDIVILFCGKLEEKKRPFNLLKAHGILNTKYSIHNTHLIFVGDGVLRPELEKYTREKNLQNVYFVGFKNQTELPKYYTLADIFVLPSGMGETWGLVVNEAMCFSLPIIVSDIVGCSPNLVKNNENGFIFPLDDINRLTQCLKELINDSQKRKSFGEKSFEIINNYNYKKDIVGILTALKHD